MAIRAPGGAGRCASVCSARLSSASIVMSGAYGKHPEAVRGGALLEDAHAVLEQRPIAAKLVDGEATKQPAFLGIEQTDRAEHRGEDAAALDVRDENPGCAESADQSQIDEVDMAEVQLADAAGALDHDDVEASGEAVVGGEDVAPQLLHVIVVARGPEVSSTRAR